MNKKIHREILNLLSEPFATNYGFCRAAVEKLLKLEPDKRVEFLSLVLENLGFVPLKNNLGVTEHLLEKNLFDSLLEEMGKDLEILRKATVSIFPPTADFAKFLLGAMDTYKDMERKSIVLWYMLKADLLPYAPDMPKSCADATPETIEAAQRKYRKNVAMLLRFINFEMQNMTFEQMADVLQKILPKEEPARTLLLALFIQRHTEKIYSAGRNSLVERGPKHLPGTASENSGVSSPKNPPRGKGGNN